MGSTQELVFALDRTGAGHHHHFFATDANPLAQVDHGGLTFPLARHLLVGFDDLDDLQHTRERRETGTIDSPVVTDQADGGPFLPRHGAGLIAHFLDDGDDPLNIFLGRPVPHHYEHGKCRPE